MDLFMAFSAGIIINIMVAFNGVLTTYSGVYTASLLSYIVAVISAGAYLIARRQKLLPKRKLPLVMYSGGVIGIFSSVFTNFAFGKITLVAITALALLAQTLTSLLIDAYGLFGAEKRKINSSSVVCLFVSLVGIGVMLVGAEIGTVSAVLLSFASGITLVVSRIINAELAQNTDAVSGAFINHFVGTPTGIVALLLLGRGEPPIYRCVPTIPWWAFLGGTAGVIVVVITNKVVPKISAFQATLLLFIGQIFAGAVIDRFTGTENSWQLILGGILVSVGVVLNALSNRKRETA